jgi:CRP-like cAMP-binding protein
MRGFREPLGADVVQSVVLKLRSLGLKGDTELNAVLSLFKATRVAERGDDLVRMGRSEKMLTVILSGVACRYRIMDSGRRQIIMFHYPGDFCDYHHYVVPQVDDPVAAITDCLVGIIAHDDLERLFEQRPAVAAAFWRATVLEARIFLERTFNGAQRPAVERIANVLCEQVVLLEASGMTTDMIPLTQIELADAAGLSVVHVNRIIQDLRELGALSKNGHNLRVANRERLMQVARFDGTYLDANKAAG